MLLVNLKKQETLPVLNKAVEFELVGGYTFQDPNLKMPDGVTPYVRKNKELKLPTVYVRFDKASNSNVEYRYAVREIPFADKSGQMQKKYTPDRIVFIGTKLVCHKNQPDLYEFLMKSPWLETDGNAKAIFREVNHQKVSQTRIDEERKRTKAKSLLLDEDRMLSEEAQRRILADLGDNTPEYELITVTDKLLAIADKEPERFLKAAGVKEAVLDPKKKERQEQEDRLTELGKLLKDPNLAKGLHMTSDIRIVEKLKEAEARWTKESNFNDAVSMGDQRITEKKFDEAKGFYSDALKLKPNDKSVKQKLEDVEKSLVPG